MRDAEDPVIDIGTESLRVSKEKLSETEEGGSGTEKGEPHYKHAGI